MGIRFPKVETFTPLFIETIDRSRMLSLKGPLHIWFHIFFSWMFDFTLSSLNIHVKRKEEKPIGGNMDPQMTWMMN